MRIIIIRTCSMMRTICAVCGCRFRPEMAVGHLEHDRNAWVCDDCIPDRAALEEQRNAGYLEVYGQLPAEQEQADGCPF